MAKQWKPLGIGGMQENKESISDSSHSSAPPEHSHSHLASDSNSGAERDVHTMGDSKYALVLLYSLDLLNEIGSLKNFQSAKPS